MKIKKTTEDYSVELLKTYHSVSDGKYTLFVGIDREKSKATIYNGFKDITFIFSKKIKNGDLKKWQAITKLLCVATEVIRKELKNVAIQK
jgi:hypothetical protein